MLRFHCASEIPARGSESPNVMISPHVDQYLGYRGLWNVQGSVIGLSDSHPATKPSRAIWRGDGKMRYCWAIPVFRGSARSARLTSDMISAILDSVMENPVCSILDSIFPSQNQHIAGI